MKITVYYPRNSKDVSKGFRVVEYEVSIKECLEVRMLSRFVDCVADLVIHKAAENFCRQYGEFMDKCIEEYIYKQGEAMRPNIEIAVRMSIQRTAEIIQKCKKDKRCIAEALRRR
jgi:hypothetical protein